MGRTHIQIRMEMTARMTRPPVRPIAPKTDGLAISCKVRKLIRDPAADSRRTVASADPIVLSIRLSSFGKRKRASPQIRPAKTKRRNSSRPAKTPV
jgi:hypothetical protein